jgi:hypothetical protein
MSANDKKIPKERPAEVFFKISELNSQPWLKKELSVVRSARKDKITTWDENQLGTCKKSKRNREVQNSIQTTKHKHSCCPAKLAVLIHD